MNEKPKSMKIFAIIYGTAGYSFLSAFYWLDGSGCRWNQRNWANLYSLQRFGKIYLLIEKKAAVFVLTKVKWSDLYRKTFDTIVFVQSMCRIGTHMGFIELNERWNWKNIQKNLLIDAEKWQSMLLQSSYFEFNIKVWPNL